MHKYYTGFDWLDEDTIEELLPEDGVPDTLKIDDLDEKDFPSSLSRNDFQDWLWEGRHDCDVAFAILRLWISKLRGSGNATLNELYDQFLDMYPSPELDEPHQEKLLPVAAIASALQNFESVPFEIAGMSPQEIHDALCQQILEECASVNAYTASWRGTGMVLQPEQKSVGDTLQNEVSQEVYPWPQIEKNPTPRFEEGRFVKSFPLQFPMGVGDLYQSGLRDDFSATKWAQHKLRYKDGWFVNGRHGHRVTWAIFNETLLEIAKAKGRAYHKSTNQCTLTKRELRTLVETQEDLVKEMASFGADIPTTPMFWKKETNRLQWIVRQMSWRPPWVQDKDAPHSAMQENARIEAAIEKCLEAPHVPATHRWQRTESDSEVPPHEKSATADAPMQPPPPSSTTNTSHAATHASEDEPIDFKQLWYECRQGSCEDTYGYGRSPAFWFTLNCPYNYLHEIHRFQTDKNCLNQLNADSKYMRWRWSLDNPDIVCQLHAIRVELIIRVVIPAVVPPTPSNPFQYWARFEQGYSGNPHAHALGYGPFNPSFDNVVKDEETRQRLIDENYPGAENLQIWDDVREELTNDFEPFVSEWHPAKDSAGEALYDFVIENIKNSDFGKPQCVDLRHLLDQALNGDLAKLDGLKRLLVALIEDGQRHTMHGYDCPKKGVHACARQKPHTTSPTEVICRYLYPKEMRTESCIEEDPYREGLFNLFLDRNDPLINSFEVHLLLANLGNIDWRPLINLWAVLEYLTKYSAKAGKPTKQLTALFDEVLTDIASFEKEDCSTDLWRRTIMKFYNRMIGW